MKKMIAVVMMLLSVASNVRAIPWNYQTDEWPIPQDVRTEADYQKYVQARKWFVAAGIALTLGSYIANRNASGLYRKAGGIRTLGPVVAHQLPGGGTSFYADFDRGASESQGRIRGKADVYRKGAMFGGLMALVCFQVAYSIRF